jgi:hypothetical protein
LSSTGPGWIVSLISTVEDERHERGRMTTIIGLCGSRRHGFNGMLLRAAGEMAQPGTSIGPESIREIPLYDGDVEEEQGVPPAVQRLKDRIAEADGLLSVTPEYNNSIPGVLKNAIALYSSKVAERARAETWRRCNVRRPSGTGEEIRSRDCRLGAILQRSRTGRQNAGPPKGSFMNNGLSIASHEAEPSGSLVCVHRRTS